MARILATGIVALDIVNEVDSYPPEDSEVRALARTIRRGGNAGNTLTVLRQLGHSCEWAGNWVDSPDSAPVMSDLDACGIGYRHARRLEQGSLPVSCITLSRATASRTIVHYRDLPEFSADAFERIPLEDFDWIHFEGRNVPETASMMRRVRQRRPSLPLSLEAEKAREGIETLFPLADVVVFSRAFAQLSGQSPEDMLADIRGRLGRGILVCTLGEDGAVALDSETHLIRCRAIPPARLVDTVGAGDTFNAGLIDALLRGATLEQALAFACRLASLKCGRAGLKELDIPAREF